MYTIINKKAFYLEEFNIDDDIEYLLRYIDDNLYSFPCDISIFKYAIKIKDCTGNEIYIIGLTPLEIEYFKLKYTKKYTKNENIS